MAGYKADKTMKGLAAEFGINRLTESAYVHRADVPIRRAGLGLQLAVEVVSLYQAG